MALIVSKTYKLTWCNGCNIYYVIMNAHYLCFHISLTTDFYNWYDVNDMTSNCKQLDGPCTLINGIP